MYRPCKFGIKTEGSEAKILRSIGAPVAVTPATGGHPLIFASPHSGRQYPPAWLRDCCASKTALRSVEDIWVDDLFSQAETSGAAYLRANFPRSLIDVNRSADDLPDYLAAPDVEISARAKAGLGVIPMAIAPQSPIYRTPPDAKAAQARIDGLYRPYHDALRGCVEDALTGCGHAVLIDCHSMPGFGPLRARRPDFILGDRYSKSCRSSLTDAVEQYLMQRGYSVSRNHPYAGGYTTRTYGRPGDGIQALQIEINRDLYVNPVNLTRKPRYDALQRDLDGLVLYLCGMHQELAQAAE